MENVHNKFNFKKPTGGKSPLPPAPRKNREERKLFLKMLIKSNEKQKRREKLTAMMNFMN